MKPYFRYQFLNVSDTQNYHLYLVSSETILSKVLRNIGLKHQHLLYKRGF